MRFAWTAYEQAQDINVREMATVLLLCTRWAKRIQSTRVKLRVDNQVSYHVMRKGAAKGSLMMELMRRLAGLQAKWHFSLEVSHIPGCVHFRSDELSRVGELVEPLTPRLRVDHKYLAMLGHIWGGFDLVKGAEFQEVGRRQQLVADQKDQRLWVHPRYDQVSAALKWMQATCARDLGSGSRGWW